MHRDRQQCVGIWILLINLALSFQVAIAQEIAAQDAPAQENGAVTAVSYGLRYKSPAEVEAVFRPLIAADPRVQLRIDADRGRITLSGPPWAHDLLEQVIDRVDRRPGTNPSPPVAQLSQPRQSLKAAGELQLPRSEQSRRLLSLPPGSAPLVRRDVLRLFGERLQVAGDSDQPWTFATPSGSLRIEFDVNREDVLIDGPVAVVDQFAKLLTALSQRYQQGGREAAHQTQNRVLLLHRNVQPKVQELMRSSSEASAKQQNWHVEGAATRGDAPRGTLRLAAQQLDAPALAQPPPAADDENDPEATSGLPELEGVEVEALPDLDAIILRGRDQDLQQLTEIIRQLEQLSRQTQPAIDVVNLRFADSLSIAELVEDSQEDLIGTRQGRAQVIPLGKPNALLLIGWGEAVTALRELISKLDRPVAPETQFKIFPLRHATATVLQQTITDFFDDRDGPLSPNIQATADERTNSLIVHAAPRDMLEVARLVQNLDTPEARAIQRTRVFAIENSLAADLAETLRQTIERPDASARAAAMELMIDRPGAPQAIVSGILENIQITVDARKNSLIISAPAENFDVIEALIRQLDSPGMLAKIKIFPIQNGDAASLVQTLRSLLPSQTGTNPLASAQLSAAPGESSLAPLRFTVDVRSNSIIATGSEGDLNIVDALVMRLDEADAMQRQNTVYQLKNSPAVDVALAVNEFLRNTRQVESASPGAVNPYDQLEKEVVVVPEPVSNKLIVSATPRYFDEIRAMIEKLDEQPPQVMIQALIAEVTLGDAEEFGVELGIQDSVLFDRSLLGNLLKVTNTTQNSTPGGVQTTTQDTIVAASNEPGFNFNNTGPLGNSGSGKALAGAGIVGGQAISNFAVDRGNDELGFGGLVLSASSQNVSVLLRALEESRRTEVLSRPQVLTLDNQPAYIQVGQRVPRITGSSINQIGQQNTVELENVGLILAVTPRISPEGNVTMEIDAEKSSVGPESEGIPVSVSAEGTIVRSPRIDVASAQATVSAADGETIILGGLITNSQKEVHRKVPFLGDLPVLQYLFRFDSMQQRRTELIIILTPHIVRSKQDVERLKQTELARMSWCAADVFDLHGEALQNPKLPALFPEEDGDWNVIYPHVDPRGRGLQEGRSIDVLPGESPPRGFVPPMGPALPPRLERPETLSTPEPADAFPQGGP